MHYWLHRISHHAELSHPLLEKGFLTIGFSDFTGEELIDKVIEDDWNYFDKHFSAVWSKGHRTRYNLYRFLRFRKGDIVIVPVWKAFHVCEIIDDRPLLIDEVFSNDLKTWGGKDVSTDGTYLTIDNKRVDLGFARRVKVLHMGISRDKFADAKLTSRMKIRQTNAIIDDLEKSIKKSISNYDLNKPINLHSILVEKTANLVLEAIRAELNDTKFEKLIKKYFETIGANKVSIPAKNERGKEGDADIVAEFENIKLIIYVQAKYHNKETDDYATSQILDYKTNKESIDDGYNRIAWVITSADSFSEEAERIAAENEIQLVDGAEFSTMLLNAGINLLYSGL